MPGETALHFVEMAAGVVEECRQHVRQIATTQAGVTPVHQVPPAETRRARAEGRGVFVKPVLLEEARTIEVTGRGGVLALRVFTPPRPIGVYLHIHGGGWVLGSAAEQDLYLRALANEASVTVASIEYRLAPEHPYPAALEDCEDVARWLIANAESQFGCTRLVIGGESAGAHLATTALLALRGRPAGEPNFAGALLTYGVFDLALTPSARAFGDHPSVLSTPTMAWFVETFLGAEMMSHRRDAEVSPLYAALGGLPPALFSVGTADLLVDDSLFMAARWRVAGNECALDIYEAAPHGFLRLPLGLSEVARHRQAAFLTHVLGSS